MLSADPTNFLLVVIKLTRFVSCFTTKPTKNGVFVFCRSFVMRILSACKYVVATVVVIGLAIGIAYGKATTH